MMPAQCQPWADAAYHVGLVTGLMVAMLIGAIALGWWALTR